MKKKLAFTLVELMVVVAIIVILVGVATPKFTLQLAKSKDAKALEVVTSWRSGFALYHSELGDYPADFGDLADKVDIGTLGKTYEDNGNSVSTIQISTTSTNQKSWVKAGSPLYVQFQIVTTSGIEEVSFITGQIATDNKDWSLK